VNKYILAAVFYGFYRFCEVSSLKEGIVGDRRFKSCRPDQSFFASTVVIKARFELSKDQREGRLANIK
jgi:hypothetical protein